MQPSEITLISRAAKPSDYRLVARLCRRAVGRGDYVLLVLRDVIAEGGLFLAWSDGELVGMVNFEECIDGSGWLGMGRTDPDWRRRGVALFLQQRIEAQARRKGIRYLRLWVLSRNRPSRLASLKGGFRPVCEATHVTNHIRVKREVRRTSPLRSASSEFLQSLLQTDCLSKMNGYFAYKWHFVKASAELMEKLVLKGEVYQDGKTSFILTKPEIAFGDRYSYFTPLQGSAASNLQRIKNLARGYGPIKVGSYLPYDGHLLSIARENGFRRDSWGNHCVVFEKRI